MVTTRVVTGTGTTIGTTVITAIGVRGATGTAQHIMTVTVISIIVTGITTMGETGMGKRVVVMTDMTTMAAAAIGIMTGIVMVTGVTGTSIVTRGKGRESPIPATIPTAQEAGGVMSTGRSMIRAGHATWISGTRTAEKSGVID